MKATGQSAVEEKFLKYQEKLVREILHANAHLKLWERLQSYRASHLEELNQAPYFFNFTMQAHLDDALLTLSRILDKSNESLSIEKLINFIEQNIQIFSTEVFNKRMMQKPDYDEKWTVSHTPITTLEIYEDRRRLKDLEKPVENLRSWRDKVIAHTDLKFFRKDKIVSKKYPLEVQQLHEAIDTILKILNRYSRAYNSSTHLKDYVGEDDVRIIMDCIRFYIEEHRRKFEAELETLKNKKPNRKLCTWFHAINLKYINRKRNSR